MLERIGEFPLISLGLIVVIIFAVFTQLRGKRGSSLSWKGFGVTFEVKPCRDCTYSREVSDE